MFDRERIGSDKGSKVGRRETDKRNRTRETVGSGRNKELYGVKVLNKLMGEVGYLSGNHCTEGLH